MSASTVCPIRQLVIIDSAVADPAQLQPGLPADSAVLALPADGNALAWLSDQLAAYQNLDAIHLLSHGAPGVLTLGGATLTADNHTNSVARRLK